MTTDSVPAHDELAALIAEAKDYRHPMIRQLVAALEQQLSLLATARADGAREALEQVDGELQQRTVYAEPYAGWKEPVDEAEGGYRRGYVSGLTSAFTEFRHISARAAVPLTERNNE